MPLTAKGEEILAAMQKEYGSEKGKQVFYASKNAGKITGIDRADTGVSPAASMIDAVLAKMDEACLTPAGKLNAAVAKVDSMMADMSAKADSVAGELARLRSLRTELQQQMERVGKSNPARAGELVAKIDDIDRDIADLMSRKDAGNSREGDPITLGSMAAKAGKKEGDNPFKSGTPDWRRWLFGFVEANRHARGDAEQDFKSTWNYMPEKRKRWLALSDIIGGQNSALAKKKWSELPSDIRSAIQRNVDVAKDSARADADRLIQTFTGQAGVVKVYFDPEWKEYRAKPFYGNPPRVMREQTWYFTDDKADALATAKVMSDDPRTF